MKSPLGQKLKLKLCLHRYSTNNCVLLIVSKELSLKVVFIVIIIIIIIDSRPVGQLYCVSQSTS